MVSVSAFITVVSAQIISRSRSGRHIKIAVWRMARRGLSTVVPPRSASATAFRAQGVFSLLVHLSAFIEIWNKNRLLKALTNLWTSIQQPGVLGFLSDDRQRLHTLLCSNKRLFGYHTATFILMILFSDRKEWKTSVFVIKDKLCLVPFMWKTFLFLFYFLRQLPSHTSQTHLYLFSGGLFTLQVFSGAITEAWEGRTLVKLH